MLTKGLKKSNMPLQMEKETKDLFEAFLSECYKNENVIPIPGCLVKWEFFTFSLIGKHLNKG